MRFAGTRIEGFMDKGTDFGALTQNAGKIKTKETTSMNDFAAQVGATGMASQAQAEAAKLTAEGQQAMAAGQAQGAMFESLGSIGSSLLGSFSGGGGGGGGYGGYSNYSGVDTSNMTGFFNPNLF